MEERPSDFISDVIAPRARGQIERLLKFISNVIEYLITELIGRQVTFTRRRECVIAPPESFKVIVHVYDVRGGPPKWIVELVKGDRHVYHTAVEVGGIIYDYGTGGLHTMRADQLEKSKLDPNANFYLHALDMGITYRSRELIINWLQAHFYHFSREKYSVLNRNCNHFSDELLSFLGCKSLPYHISKQAQCGLLGLAAGVLFASTPLSTSTPLHSAALLDEKPPFMNMPKPIEVEKVSTTIERNGAIPIIVAIFTIAAILVFLGSPRAVLIGLIIIYCMKFARK